jgi:hypothetical protein
VLSRVVILHWFSPRTTARVQQRMNAIAASENTNPVLRWCLTRLKARTALYTAKTQQQRSILQHPTSREICIVLVVLCHTGVAIAMQSHPIRGLWSTAYAHDRHVPRSPVEILIAANTDRIGAHTILLMLLAATSVSEILRGCSQSCTGWHLHRKRRRVKQDINKLDNYKEAGCS